MLFIDQMLMGTEHVLVKRGVGRESREKGNGTQMNDPAVDRRTTDYLEQKIRQKISLQKILEKGISED